MTEARDKVTRFAAELVDSAAAEGARTSRSAREQLDHWVRLGRAVAGGSPESRLRVEAVRAGELAITSLSGPETGVYHAEIATAIEERLASVDFGAALAREGVVTVALDDQGNLVEQRPDGSRVALGSF